MNWKEQFFEMMFPLRSSEMRMEQAYLLKYQNLPWRIYKYKDVNEHSKINLLENTVWLADPESLNDPYDCSHALNLRKLDLDFYRSPPSDFIDLLPKEHLESGILDQLKSSENPTETLIDLMLVSEPKEQRDAMKQALLSAMSAMNAGIAKKFITKMKTAFKLCSFSERVDSTLMWSHYANYHKGFCIEYDIKSVPPDNYVSRFLYPVAYSDSIPDLTAHTQRGIDDPEFNNLYPNLIGLRKASDWAYEREWRLLFANGILDKPQSYAMPKPTMVYLGSHISEKHQNEITEICGRIDVPVKKMQHSLTEYKMQSVTLEEADRTFFKQRA